jgi:hypothetical protein
MLWRAVVPALDEQPIREKDQQCASNGDTECGQIEPRDDRVAEDAVTDEAAQQRAENSECRSNQTPARVFTRHDQFGDAARQQAEQHLSEDVTHGGKVTREPHSLKVPVAELSACERV